MQTVTFTLAHLSDPHLSSLEQIRFRDLLNQRIIGYLSWRSHRRAEHSPEILAALAPDLSRIQPDHIVVTGDLTHVGLPSEFRQVRQWLRRLGPPDRVTVIPGNHDAYIDASWRRTFARWRPYMASDGATESRTPLLFPTLRIRGPVALIGLSTARPSTPFFAVGSVGRAQLQRLDRLLLQLQGQDLFRVLLLHHPPQSAAVQWSKRLTDSAGLRDVLARRGVDLILHGHAHYPVWGELATPAGTAPVIGAPSASARGHKPDRRAQYHIYQLRRVASGWELGIQMRGYRHAEGGFVAEREQRLLLPGAR